MGEFFEDHKKFIIIFSIIIIIITSIASVLIYYATAVKVDKINVVQKGQILSIAFENDKARYYTVQVESSDFQKSIITDKSELGIKVPVLGKVYKITVFKDDFIGKFFKKNRSFTTKKLKQEISIEKTVIKGFAKNEEDFNPEAKTKLVITSSNEEVVEAAENKLSLKKPGRAIVTISAEESDVYLPSTETVEVVIYPKKLKTPKVKFKAVDDLYSEIIVKKVDYGETYLLQKKSSTLFLDIKTLKEDKLKYKVINDGSSYRVIAKAKILEKNIKSDPSEEVSVPNSIDEVSSYSERHIIKTFSRSDFSKEIKLSPAPGTQTPQSFSPDGAGGYWVGYSSQNGKKSAYKHYDKNGKSSKPIYVKGGHLNGSVYNPFLELFYSTKTHLSIKSKKVDVFDKSGSRRDKISVPSTYSGIAYDALANKYCLSGGSKLWIFDSKFNREKTIVCPFKYRHAQDCGAGNGVCIKTSWNGGNDSWVDLYRLKDSKYIGSFEVPFGEIESATSYNKHLVLLVNNPFNSYIDMILVTEDIFPQL